MQTLKLYLDICSYNRPFDNQGQMKVRLETEAKLYIQAGIRDKRYLLAWSYMLDLENNNSPYDERKSAIAPWKTIADCYCPSSSNVLSLGREIMLYGIRSKDALHIACAIQSGCDYFITTDNKLTNKTVANIRIINPVNFINERDE